VGGSLGLSMMPQIRRIRKTCMKCLDSMNRVMCEYSVARESRMEAMRRHDAGELHLGSLKAAQLISGGIVKWSETYQGRNRK
jgi:hypothetical protein